MSSFELEIKRVYAFPAGEGKAVAGVTLSLGPVTIRAKLMEGDDGLWLAMPSRKGKDDQWFYQVFFEDRRLHREAERLAVEAYQALQQAA